jgi:hypothetical protein
VPPAAYEVARKHFDEEEFAQFVWAIVVINAWHRVALTLRSRPGEHQPGRRMWRGPADDRDVVERV